MPFRIALPALAFSAALVASALASSALAAPAAAPRSIPLALAKEAADVALSTCAANGYKVAVSVVDAQGNPRLTEVADGAFYMAGVYSGWKGKTAARLDETTASLAAKAKTDPAVAQKIRDNGGGDSAGGQPLVADGTVVGAIGVGGAPGARRTTSALRPPSRRSRTA